MKRILAIALLLVAPMGLPAQHCGKECCPAKPLDAIRDASVSIMSVSTKGERAAGSGTVFDFQGHTYVLTAAHVFHEDIQFIAVARDNGRHKKQVVYALPKAMSKTHDLALISLGENVFDAQPLRLCCEPKVGDKLIHCGTAKGLYHQSVHFGHVSGPVRDWKGQGGKMGQANLTVHQGCSGGGVFLECGAFVGVVVQLDGDGVVFYVPTEVVRGFLKAAKCCECPKCECDPCECGEGCECQKCPPKPKKKATLPSPSKQLCGIDFQVPDYKGMVVKNRTATDGHGMSVECCVQSIANRHRIDAMRGFVAWAENRSSSGYPNGLAGNIADFCKQHGVKEPRYVSLDSTTVDVVESLVKTGWVMVSEKAGPDSRYGAEAHTAAIVVYCDKNLVVLLDPNFDGPEILRRKEFDERFTGWAFTFCQAQRPRQLCCDHFGLTMAIISAGEQAQASEWPFVSQAGYWANYHEANAYLQDIGAAMQRLDEMLGIYGLEHHWDGPSALYGGGWHGQQLLQLRGALQAEYHDARSRVDAWSEVWYMMDPAYRDTNGPGAIRRLIDMVGEHDFAAGRWPMPSPWTGWRWR